MGMDANNLSVFIYTCRQLAEEQKKLAELLLLQSHLETLAFKTEDDSPIATRPITQQPEESSQHSTKVRERHNGSWCLLSLDSKGTVYFVGSMKTIL